MIAYLITNQQNGKQYVGITTRNIDRRWYEHKYVSNSCGQLLAKAIKKYGEDSFTIEHIASAIGNVDNLKSIEQDLIAQFDTKVPNGYNLTDGGDGVFGFKFSEAQRKRIGDSKRGTKHSEKTKTKMRESHLGEKNHFFGKKHTDTSKRKNIEAHIKHKVLAINITTKEQIILNGAGEMRAHNFNPSHVYECISGKAKTHKNFMFKRI